MSNGSVAAAVVVAALVFWVVGAHNRLVRLRGELVRCFAPVATAAGERQALLQRQIDALASVLASARPRLDTLQAACRQADAALALAKTRPALPGPIASLRVAEEILADARARLPAQGALGTELAELQTQLVAVDAALVFARSQFNAAVASYNAAARQFPTIVVAGLFGLRAAGTL